MFSKRTAWDFQQNRISQAISALKLTQKGFWDLTKSNPTDCGFAYPQEEILNSFINDKNLCYDPDAQGMLKAREAVSGYYASKGISVDAQNIFLTASTSEGYSMLFKLLANPRDTILFPQPSYPLFQFLCDMNDVHIGYYPLRYRRRWEIAIEEREQEQASSSPRALVMVNPNNPTGSAATPEEIHKINGFCQQRDMAIICDEVFSDFFFSGGQQYESLVLNKDVLTFTLSGVSKILGLPQMKLSWIIINGPQDSVKQAKQRLEMIADTFLSVNTPVQNGLKDWFQLMPSIQRSIKERIHNNRQCLRDCLKNNQGVQLLNAEGGWYAVLSVPTLSNEEEFLLGLIEEDRVIVHPGYFYDFNDEGYLVLSLIVEQETFTEGLKRLLQRLMPAS